MLYNSKMELYSELNSIKNYKSVCIIGHISPDADALASMMVFRNFLISKFNLNKVDIFAESSKLQPQQKMLLDNVPLNPEPSNYEIAIMMDSPNAERLGIYKNLFDSADLKIVIDHHQTNMYQGDINIVQQQSSTCEIVYDIVQNFEYNLSQPEMEKIYAGIITDTNNFSVGKINNKTFKIVSEIIDNVDSEEIYNNFFRNNSLKNMQILSTAIRNISTSENNQIIISHITPEEAETLHAHFDDYVGIINRLATINNSKLVCFTYPKHESFYVSMRARGGYKISHLATKHGGGGHDGAAAFLTNKSIQEIEEEILEDFKILINEKNN